MDKLNQTDNRARKRSNAEKGYTANLGSLQVNSYSADENVRVEQHVAHPNYKRKKTLAGSAPISDQANPNVTPPDPAEVWDLKGFRGGHGYVELDAAEDVDIELWARDQQNNKWFLVGTAVDVPSLREFRFSGGIRGRQIWIRLTNIGTSIASIALAFSPE